MPERFENIGRAERAGGQCALWQSSWEPCVLWPKHLYSVALELVPGVRRPSATGTVGETAVDGQAVATVGALGIEVGGGTVARLSGLGAGRGGTGRRCPVASSGFSFK